MGSCPCWRRRKGGSGSFREQPPRSRAAKRGLISTSGTGLHLSLRVPRAAYIYASIAGRSLALADAGFTLSATQASAAAANNGREWHKAGLLANKPKAWRDLIAVCETLCADTSTAW